MVHKQSLEINEIENYEQILVKEETTKKSECVNWQLSKHQF